MLHLGKSPTIRVRACCGLCEVRLYLFKQNYGVVEIIKSVVEIVKSVVEITIPFFILSEVVYGLL